MLILACFVWRFADTSMFCLSVCSSAFDSDDHDYQMAYIVLEQQKDLSVDDLTDSSADQTDGLSGATMLWL